MFTEGIFEALKKKYAESHLRQLSRLDLSQFRGLPTTTKEKLAAALDDVHDQLSLNLLAQATGAL